MREEERDTGMENEEEHNALVIVETEHLSFCSGYFREELLSTSRFYDVIAVLIVQLVLHQVFCVSVF